MKLVYDIDFVIFAAASIVEDKYVIAKHTPSGKEMEFENVTALWGHHKKKEGGFIAKANEEAGEVIYKVEDFEVSHHQRLKKMEITEFDGIVDTVVKVIEPLDFAKRVIKNKINEINTKLGATSYKAYTGRGETFRHSIATLQPYKGNREDFQSPLLLKELKQWCVDNMNTIWVENDDPAQNIEADDAVSIAVYKGYEVWKKTKKDSDKVIGVAIDKDRKGCTGWWFNPDKQQKAELIEGFGKLFLNEKDEIDGDGRIWLYWQTLHGDDTDNYKTSCFSSTRYAGKGAFNDLKDCKNDKEALEVMVRVAKALYPEKKTVNTFRGEIEIDGLYVLREMFNLARMLRFKGDKVDIVDVMNKLGVKYE